MLRSTAFYTRILEIKGGLNMPNIGKLIEVDIRELWQHEQYDYSRWPARESNLEYLNEILGLTLTDVIRIKF